MFSKKHQKLKFIEADNILQCPICNTFFSVDNESLMCENGHNFDISKKGYINFTSNIKEQIYTKDLFLNRRKIFSKGYYDKIVLHIEAIVNNLISAKNRNLTILDSGSGEGYYSNILSNNEKVHVYGIDISKDAINIASSGSNNSFFAVADIAKLPFKDKSFDVILDILTPANYSQFKRILKDDGIIIKVIPAPNYLMEIREAIGTEVFKKEYENTDTIDHLSKNLNVISKELIFYKKDVDFETFSEFLKMTPMTFNREVSFNDSYFPNIITIELEIYVCTK